MPLSVALHALAAVIWVGGMFFAHQILRPAMADLATPERQRLWDRVLGGFFPVVVACVVVLLATGYHMLFAGFGGFAGAGIHVHVMHLVGWLMFLLFFHLYFAPWRRYRKAVAAGETEVAGRELATIRRVVGINLVLGLVTVAVGASGRYWG
jgi:uncharacterized membrane protein